MSEWFSGKEFAVGLLLFGFNSGGSLLQQFYLELKEKNCLMSIIFISSSSISEWSRGEEFGVSYLLFGFNSGGTLFQQF